MENVQDKTLSFRVLGQAPRSGKVRNPDATVGSVAARYARSAGIAGSFDVLDKNGQAVMPETRLADLPQDAELTLASEFTPAMSIC